MGSSAPKPLKNCVEFEYFLGPFEDDKFFWRCQIQSISVFKLQAGWNISIASLIDTRFQVCFNNLWRWSDLFKNLARLKTCTWFLLCRLANGEVDSILTLSGWFVNVSNFQSGPTRLAQLLQNVLNLIQGQILMTRLLSSFLNKTQECRMKIYNVLNYVKGRVRFPNEKQRRMPWCWFGRYIGAGLVVL